MKLIQKLSMIVVVMAMFAFTAIEPTDVTGKYGSKEGVKMELNLMENGEFTYVNNSNAESPITAKGKWELDKNKIVLSEYGDAEIQGAWRFDEKKKAIHSRDGLTFYRMANCAPKSCCSKDKAKSCSKDKKE